MILMDKRYKITALCGMGLGTSSLARMAIMDYVKSHDIDATVTVADIGSVKSIDADIILTTKSMASHISDDIRSRTTVTSSSLAKLSKSCHLAPIFQLPS